MFVKPPGEQPSMSELPDAQLVEQRRRDTATNTAVGFHDLQWRLIPRRQHSQVLQQEALVIEVQKPAPQQLASGIPLRRRKTLDFKVQPRSIGKHVAQHNPCMTVSDPRGIDARNRGRREGPASDLPAEKLKLAPNARRPAAKKEQM
mmetsp:Transcript_25174/g.55756  ORF Transcript_25174/g.55756 Transcript_25174/m.55756 type:complete len:147 (+) Transcript_25174:99-539(+)